VEVPRRDPPSATTIQTQAPINPGDPAARCSMTTAAVGIMVGSAMETDGVSFAGAEKHIAPEVGIHRPGETANLLGRVR